MARPTDTEITKLCEMFQLTKLKAMAWRRKAHREGLDIWKYAPMRQTSEPITDREVLNRMHPQPGQVILFELKDQKWRISRIYKMEKNESSG